MKKFKRLLSCIIAIAMSATIFSGCGVDSDDGKTNLSVSEIGFGGEWLERHPEEHSVELIRYAGEKGINIIDCWMNDEKSRSIIGEGIKENRDKDYIWKYDLTKDFDKQEISKYTLGILTNLMLEYVLDKEDSENVIKELKENDIILEKEKQEKYPVDVFKDRKSNTNKYVQKVEENKNELIVYNQKKGLIQRIIE